MKISKLFHYLYAAIMFLPLVVLPVFSIYIINHEPEPISITVESEQVVDFNQKVSSENLRSDFTSNGLTFTASGETFIVTGENTNNSRVQWYCTNTLSLDNTHIYYVTSYRSGDYDDYLGPRVSITYNDDSRSYPTLPYRLSNAKSISYYLQNDGTHYDYNFSIQWQLFDLTQMYGVGNEPTSSDFLADFPNDFYEYTLSDLIVLDVTQVLYNDTDIGSQYLYSLYHVVDKYFNFNVFAPFGNLYHWFVTNVFLGASSLGFTILYQLFIYWLFVSLLWLLFDVFMYIPLIMHNAIDKARLE